MFVRIHQVLLQNLHPLMHLNKGPQVLRYLIQTAVQALLTVLQEEVHLLRFPVIGDHTLCNASVKNP